MLLLQAAFGTEIFILVFCLRENLSTLAVENRNEFSQDQSICKRHYSCLRPMTCNFLLISVKQLFV